MTLKFITIIEVVETHVRAKCHHIKCRSSWAIVF